MQSGLAGKVALITGASGGIGRAIASALAAEGASVALHAHANGPALRNWVEQQDWKDQATVVSADVRQPGSIEAAMMSAAGSFGRVDVCVVNAGIWAPESGPLHELAESRIRNVVETNLLGATWTARAFLKSLAKTGPRDDGDGAALVFVGSTAGRFGEAGHAEYAISKAGLYGLLRSLKVDELSITTGESYVQQLQAFFRMREKKMYR